MKISVVVPVLNARQTMPLCIDALLHQVRLPDAIYVVDNGSTDGTYEWLKERSREEPLLRLLREAKCGPSAARNAALRIVEDGIVAFTDADCVPELQWLDALTAELTEHDVAAVAGSVIGYQPRTLVERYSSIIGYALPDQPCVVHRCSPFVGFATVNMAVRTTVLRRLGGFDEEMITNEDFDLSWRILKEGGTIAYVPHARVAHIYRSSLCAMLKRLFEYGTFRPSLIAKHFRGVALVAIRSHVIEIRGPSTLFVNLTSPEKVSLALIGLSALSPWALGLLALYWVRLALLVKRAAKRRGVAVRSPGELMMLTGLHLLQFCASNAGSLIASPRYGALCV